MIALERVNRNDRSHGRTGIWGRSLPFGREAVEEIPAIFVEEGEFFRIDAEIILQYWPLKVGAGTAEATRTEVSISGGGLRFSPSTPLYPGQQLWLELALPGANPAVISCIGEVALIGESEAGLPEAALRFVRLRSRDQDRIVGFCFAEQRRMLRRKVRVV